MEIIWNENPLKTQVVLTQHEKDILWYKLKIDLLIDAMCAVELSLDKEFNENLKRSKLGPDYVHTPEAMLAEVREELRYDYHGGEDTGEGSFNARVDEMHRYYVESLLGSHGGDCTCFCATCIKCDAEHKMGINTIEGLNKHAGHYVCLAFNRRDCDLDKAIQNLEEFKPRKKFGSDDALQAQWSDWAAAALTWLVKYREDHFKGKENESR